MINLINNLKLIKKIILKFNKELKNLNKIIWFFKQN